jgi:ketosteroid isomerase-like protein
MAVATTVESVVDELFAALDGKNFERIKALATDDIQGVDELSRRWMRGRAAMDAYFDELRDSVVDIHSTLRDIHTVEIGDVGILTCVLDQWYEHEGHRSSIEAPTTIVARRIDGEWRIVVLHSVPLPAP